MVLIHEPRREKGSEMCLRFGRQLDCLIKAILSTIRDVDDLDNFTLETIIELSKHSSKHHVSQAGHVQQSIALESNLEQQGEWAGEDPEVTYHIRLI